MAKAAAKAAAKPKTQYGYAGHSLPVPAQEAGEELARIEAERGGLRPAEIVEESEPAEAVLHPCFTWDNDQAAQLHREGEARRILRSVRVVRIDQSGHKEKAPAFISVTQAGPVGRSYVNSARVLSDDDLRVQALSEAMSQLEGIRRRYQSLTELAEVFRAIDDLRKPG